MYGVEYVNAQRGVDALGHQPHYFPQYFALPHRVAWSKLKPTSSTYDGQTFRAQTSPPFLRALPYHADLSTLKYIKVP